MEPDVCIWSALTMRVARCAVSQLTGNDDISIVGHKVLNDLLGAVHDIDVAPVDPGMVGLQGSGEQVVASSAHGLPARTLSLEPVTILDILTELEAKILLDDRGAPERNGVGPLLYPVELHGQNSDGVVGRVSDQECDVNEMVRIRQLGEQLEVLGQVRGGVLEGGQDEYPFVVLKSLFC